MHLHAVFKAGLATGFCLLTASCVIFKPEKIPNYSNCETISRQMTLTAEQLKANPSGKHSSSISDTDPRYLAALGVLVTGGSLLVSGSVVLVNNTLHWVELQGDCKNLQQMPATPQHCIQECDLTTQKCQCLPSTR